MTSSSETTPNALSGKAVTYQRAGGPDVIEVVRRTVRPPQVGEVRMRVTAAAVNPTDVLLRDTGYNGTATFPATPGMDAAGVIEAVGPGVSQLHVGQEVMAVVLPVRPEGGAQAAHLVVTAASVGPIPQGTSLAQAATLPMNGLTALRALELAGLQPGQTLAVSGGAGLLAHYTIAAAKSQGLTVIADAKPEESELVRSYGADKVVARGDGFAAAIRREFPEGVDALLDTALLAEKSFAAIRDGGIYLPVRGWGDAPSERGIRIKPVWVSDALERTDWLDQLRQLVEGGAITLRVTGEYAPEQLAEAQRSLLAGGLRGRPIIVF
jgi:NADPH2:quinone reductase